MLYRLVKKEDSFCLSAALHTVQWITAVNKLSKLMLSIYIHTELAEECITAAVDKKAKHKYFFLKFIEVLLGFTTFETC